MKISTKKGSHAFYVYNESLNKKNEREAYLDLLKSLIVSSKEDPQDYIEVKGDTIECLDDETLIRIGKTIIEKEEMLEYYNQLNHQRDFFYEFKETYYLTLKKAIEPLRRTFDGYKESFTGIGNVYSGLMESIKTNFAALGAVISGVAKSIDIELLKKKVNKAERFNNIAIELEWFPTAVGNQLSLNDIIQIVNLYDSEGKEKTQEVIDVLFVKLYDEDEISRLYAGWEKNSILKGRLSILREGVDSHLAKHFNASVCTILPQIEGVIHEIIPMSVRKIHEGELKKAVGSIVDNKNYNQATKEFYFKIILTEFWHGDEIPVLSRHAILHGEDTNFGTEVNSLKLVLLFDFLQEQIAEHKTQSK